MWWYLHDFLSTKPNIKILEGESKEHVLQVRFDQHLIRNKSKYLNITNTCTLMTDVRSSAMKMTEGSSIWYLVRYGVKVLVMVKKWSLPKTSLSMVKLATISNEALSGFVTVFFLRCFDKLHHIVTNFSWPLQLADSLSIDGHRKLWKLAAPSDFCKILMPGRCIVIEVMQCSQMLVNLQIPKSFLLKVMQGIKTRGAWIFNSAFGIWRIWVLCQILGIRPSARYLSAEFS